jgi:hypothetical protein
MYLNLLYVTKSAERPHNRFEHNRMDSTRRKTKPTERPHSAVSRRCVVFGGVTNHIRPTDTLDVHRASDVRVFVVHPLVTTIAAVHRMTRRRRHERTSTRVAVPQFAVTHGFVPTSARTSCGLHVGASASASRTSDCTTPSTRPTQFPSRSFYRDRISSARCSIS